MTMKVLIVFASVVLAACAFRIPRQADQSPITATCGDGQFSAEIIVDKASRPMILRSYNYGIGNYGNYDNCTISLYSLDDVTATVTIRQSQIEQGFDKLCVAGNVLTGTTEPGTRYTRNIAKDGTLTFYFTSDVSVTMGGWEIYITVASNPNPDEETSKDLCAINRFSQNNEIYSTTYNYQYTTGPDRWTNQYATGPDRWTNQYATGSGQWTDNYVTDSYPWWHWSENQFSTNQYPYVTNSPTPNYTDNYTPGVTTFLPFEDENSSELESDPEKWVTCGDGNYSSSLFINKETGSTRLRSFNFGKGNYNNLSNCTLRLVSLDDVTVTATLRHAETEGSFDKLCFAGRILSGTTTPGTSYTTNIPFGGSQTFYFTSDYSITMRGWEILITVVPNENPEDGRPYEDLCAKNRFSDPYGNQMTTGSYQYVTESYPWWPQQFQTNQHPYVTDSPPCAPNNNNNNIHESSTPGVAAFFPFGNETGPGTEEWPEMNGENE